VNGLFSNHSFEGGELIKVARSEAFDTVPIDDPTGEGPRAPLD